MVPTVEQLRIVLQHHGLDGLDAVSAMEAYLRAGTISADDRDLLDRLAPADRSAWMSQRWGIDAVRVAAVAYEQGIGGMEPWLSGNHRAPMRYVASP